MIVLDTNVVSELIRHTPDPAVTSWVDQHPEEDVAMTAVTAAELLYGVVRLPDGRRKRTLAAKVHEVINDDFYDQILPFDHVAAPHYAEIYVARRRAGRPTSAADVQIAAITRAYGGTLATRNTKDFDDAGLDVVNPWEPAPELDTD